MSTAGAKRPLASRSKAKVERTAASRKKLKPAAELKIIETRVYRGPNYWSYEPAIKLVVDLGVLEQFPSNTIPGFVEGLLDMLPGGRQPLLRHRPRRRLRGAPARGHLAGPRGRAHRAAAAARGGHRGRPRQDPQHRRARAVPRRLLVRRGERRPGGRAPGGPAGQPPGHAGAGLRLPGRVREAGPAGRARGLRPVDPGHPGRGRPARHPVHPAERAVAGAAGPRRPPAAHPRHHDQPDQLAGRRHRVRQEADQQAAGGDRRAGAPLRGGPQRAGGVRRGRHHRLPGGDQAAGRQPRPGRHPQPGR